MARKNFKMPVQYKLTDLPLYEERPYEIDLAPLLLQFAKPNSRSHINHFFYKTHIARGFGGLKRGDQYTHIYRDAEYTMVLSTRTAKKWLKWLLPIALIPSRSIRESAIACIGFEINQKDMLVKQIQGVQGMKDQLNHIQWEKFLLKLVEDLALANNFEKVKVIPGNKNKWYNAHHAEIFHMRYDVTAKRSGFKFCPKEECYVKQLAVVA